MYDYDYYFYTKKVQQEWLVVTKNECIYIYILMWLIIVLILFVASTSYENIAVF